MKRRCVNCEYGYVGIDDVQSCGFGLEDGAAPVGEICPMDGNKLKNCEI